MPFRLININQYREVPGTRKTSKNGVFDVLTCSLQGPTSLKENYRPLLGTRHTSVDPQGFSNLFLSDRTEAENGVLTVFSCTFTGFFGDPPAPLISFNSQETAASVSVLASEIVNMGKTMMTGMLVNGTYVPILSANETLQFGGYGQAVSIIPMFGQVGVVQRFGYSQVSCNYIEHTCTYKYPVIGQPTGPKYGPTNVYNVILSTVVNAVSGVEITSGFVDGRGVVSNSTNVVNPYQMGPDRSSVRMPAPQDICTFSANSIAPNLYECVETWCQKYIDSSHEA